MKHEWKIHLEMILCELRVGAMSEALLAAENAIALHPGKGRLWAIAIQLHRNEEVKQWTIFQQAIQQVPKSGEVWCEGARLTLSPVSPYFSIEAAKRYLTLALQFTPQYGDSFLECLRMKMLLLLQAEEWRSRTEEEQEEEGEDEELGEEEGKKNKRDEYREEIYQLIQMAVYAEPNYGAGWNMMRTQQSPPGKATTTTSMVEEAAETPRVSMDRSALSVMLYAQNRIEQELQRFAPLYRYAMAHSRTEIETERAAAERPTQQQPSSEDKERASLAVTSSLSPSARSVSWSANELDQALSFAWRNEHFNSVYNLYPVLSGCSDLDKHRILFGNDPLSP